MFCLYDLDGILRFVNSDKEACLDYAELFGINPADFCLMNIGREKDINLVQNLAENSN